MFSVYRRVRIIRRPDGAGEGLYVLDCPYGFVGIRLHPLVDGVLGRLGDIEGVIQPHCDFAMRKSVEVPPEGRAHLLDGILHAFGDARVPELSPAFLALVALVLALRPCLDDLAAILVRAFDCVGYGLAELCRGVLILA